MKSIIVGAGIGGLAAARGLLALGWDVVIYEQASSFRPVGAGITLAPNAVRALDWLGVGAALQEQSAAHGAVGIRDASGRWLMRAPAEALEERFGVPAFALHRAALHEILARGVPGSVIRTSHHVTAVVPGERPVVRFEGPDGPGEDAADLVIGADGIDSAVRASLFPDHPGPAYAGYIAWRGIVAAGDAPAGSRDFGATETWGRGERFGIVPLGDGQIYWFAVLGAPAGSHREDTLADLRARFGHWHDPIPAVLEATRPESLLLHDIRYLKEPLPRFHEGNVVLLGDAAHAMTPDLGQGGCQALEDAVTLVALLDEHNDARAALAAYDRERVPRTRKVVEASARIGRVAQLSNPVAASVRNALLRLVPASAVLRASDETAGWTPPATPPRNERSCPRNRPTQAPRIGSSGTTASSSASSSASWRSGSSPRRH